MFETYTEKARRVIFFARHEASQFGSPRLETEHLLLGLLREYKALTQRILPQDSSDSIRKQIEAHTPVRKKTPTSVDLPLSDEFKRVLTYAAEESERLSHRYIGTEHLLLGLVREEKCFAAEILAERGLKLAVIREELRSTTQEGQQQPQTANIKKVTTHISQNEGLIFEHSSPGKKAYRLRALDVPAVDVASELGAALRTESAGLPEVSEIEIIRHFTRLSTWNYAVDHGMYPLGSCTMKYNPRVNEVVARLDSIAGAHPYQPERSSQGALRIMKALADQLIEITGMDAITLQPAAGAHGELTGILLMRAYLESKGNARKKVLIPDSAHGTNPATAAMVGYQVENLRSNERGMVDLAALEAQMNEDVAGLMLTNPNTLGIFEEQIAQIAEILHRKGGLLYMDGANMNALVAKARPGDFGVDMMHLNLHKTFSTPHGGGGPGSGPVACKAHLEPFLPKPIVVESSDGRLCLDYDRPQSIGRVRAFFGNFGMHVRALAYIMANGPDGLRQTTEDAVLNANYLRKKLEGTFDLPYATPTMHEVVFSDKLQAKLGIKTGDIAKRLIDYGFHPYTVSFPMVVHGALMIEPTESEPLEELDLFVDAMKSIAQEAIDSPDLIKNAPHSTRLSRLDETAAARKPILRWKPE